MQPVLYPFVMMPVSKKSGSDRLLFASPGNTDELLLTLREKFRPKERGAIDGQNGVPAPSAEVLSEVENEIILAVQEERNNAKERLQGDLQGLEKRLSEGNVETRVDELKGTLGDVDARQTSLRTELVAEVQGAHRANSEANDAIGNFRRKHQIDRHAFVHGPGMKAFLWGLLCVLLLFETILNGALLAQEDSGGFLGGYGTALAISIINLGVPCLLGASFLRWIVHRDPARKTVGVVLFLLYVAVFLLFNLAVAHYREAPTTGDAISNMTSNWFALPEFQSWLLFILGFFLSIVALADGWKLAGEPYWGYGKLQEKLDEARTEFYETQRKALRNLDRKRKELRSEIATRRRRVRYAPHEHNSLLKERENVIERSHDAHDRLQQVGRTLLADYRTANETARGSAAPLYFKEEWEMDEEDEIGASRFNYVSEAEAGRMISSVLSDSEAAEEALNAACERIHDDIAAFTAQ